MAPGAPQPSEDVTSPYLPRPTPSLRKARNPGPPTALGAGGPRGAGRTRPPRASPSATRVEVPGGGCRAQECWSEQHSTQGARGRVWGRGIQLPKVALPHLPASGKKGRAGCAQPAPRAAADLKSRVQMARQHTALGEALVPSCSN